MNDRAIVEFVIVNREFRVDLEIPLNITANELIFALNNAYELGIDTTDVKKSYLKAEKPIALLKGNRLISEYGVRNGTVIFFDE